MRDQQPRIDVLDELAELGAPSRARDAAVNAPIIRGATRDPPTILMFLRQLAQAARRVAQELSRRHRPSRVQTEHPTHRFTKCSVRARGREFFLEATTFADDRIFDQGSVINVAAANVIGGTVAPTENVVPAGPVMPMQIAGEPK